MISIFMQIIIPSLPPLTCLRYNWPKLASCPGYAGGGSTIVKVTGSAGTLSSSPTS